MDLQAFNDRLFEIDVASVVYNNDFILMEKYLVELKSLYNMISKNNSFGVFESTLRNNITVLEAKLSQNFQLNLFF